jgi:hypothetical protein
MRDLVRTLPLRGVGADIAQDLIGIPVVTSTSSSKRYGVSYQAANSGIARLVEAGVLKEVTGGSYGRVFLAEQVVKAIEA